MNRHDSYTTDKQAHKNREDDEMTDRESISTEEFRKRNYHLRGRHLTPKRNVSPRDPAHRQSKKPSQIRGYRAGGIVTIIVNEEDILP